MFSLGLDNSKCVTVDGVPIPCVVSVDCDRGRVVALSVDDHLRLRPTQVAQVGGISDQDRLAGIMPELAPGSGGFVCTVYLGAVEILQMSGPRQKFEHLRHRVLQFDEWPKTDAR